MSAPVDVLAVLRRHADLADQVACDAQRAEAHEVLAAVTELIEAAISARSQLRAAAKELRLLSFSFQEMHCDAISDHLDAAISGVQGAKS